MKLRDPKARDDVAGRPDGYVEVSGDLVPVDGDGTFSHPSITREWAARYAEREGVDVSVVLVGESPEDATDAYPTNEDGDPLCVGKDDGQCSRVVDSPGGTCWQHGDEE